MERKAIEDSRKATLPADASGYKLELPADFVTPQGYRVQVRPQRSAGATRARVCARKWLVPSTVFKIDYDRRIAQVAELMQTNNAIAAQIKKPGASGTPRVNAIHTFMDAVLGAELARPFKATMVTEAMVRLGKNYDASLGSGRRHLLSGASRTAGVERQNPKLRKLIVRAT